jgi:catechol 2,3-dioxygenase-like lactoylglutathione lyase family enzyme
MTTATEVKVLKAHLALNVRDVERSIEFYRKMLGIEPSKVRTGYAKFDVQNPPLNLTLNQHSFNEQGALSHLGLQVSSTEDVLAVRERWAESGLIPRDEMNTNCCYARQDKTWVHDPDGYEWEVFVVLEDNLAETTLTESAGVAAAGSCGCASTAPAEAAAGGCCAPAAPVSLSR